MDGEHQVRECILDAGVFETKVWWIEDLDSLGDRMMSIIGNSCACLFNNSAYSVSDLFEFILEGPTARGNRGSSGLGRWGLATVLSELLKVLWHFLKRVRKYHR